MDSSSKMDPEEFQAWLDSRMTQWVLSCLREQMQAREAEAKEYLFRSARLPDQWASLQPNAAFVQGQCDFCDYVVNLKLEDLQDDE